MSKILDSSFPNSLSRSFLVYLLVAVALPILAFVKIAYDSYSQEVALNQKQITRKHRDMAKSLDIQYLSYKEQVKKIGRQFSRDQSLQELPGVRDENLRFKGVKKFLVRLEKNPADKRKLLLGYARQKRRYKEKIWEALYEDPTLFDEWKAPLKVQVSAWERPVLGSQANPYYRDFVPDPEHVQEAEFIKSFQEGDLLTTMPMHQIFYLGSPIMAEIWNNVERMARELFLKEMFGAEHTPLGDVRNIERASKVNIAENRRNFLPFEIPGFLIELYWDILPSSFNSEEFRANVQPAPEGLVFVVFDTEKSEVHYLELLRGLHRTKELSRVNEALDQWKANLTQDQIGFLSINLQRMNHKGARVGSYVTVGCDPEKGCRQPENESLQTFLPYPFTMNPDLPRVDSIIGVLNEETGLTVIEGKAQLEFLNKFGKKDGETLKNSTNSIFEELLKTSTNLKKALSFTYVHSSGEQMIGTVYPSTSFGSRAFIFLQSQEEFLARIMRKQLRYLGFLVVIILGIILVGRVLSREVVTPIVELSGFISQLANGQQIKFLHGSRNDEIGDLGKEFQRMGHRINEKLFEMRTIGTVNLLMNQDFSKSLMLRYILHVLCIRYGASFGVIGFFENRLSEIVDDYELWDDSPSEGRNILGILPSLIHDFQDNQDGVRYLSTVELHSMGLELDSGVACRLQPGQDEKAHLQGFLFMAGMKQNPREIFPDPVVNPLVHLGTQAKLAAVKVLLDEIQSDAKKGQEIQEGLMPSAKVSLGIPLDIGHYFHGARGLAGDFFDILVLKPGSMFGFVIADVSGKGVGPSIFGATAKAYLKVLAMDTPKDPAHVLKGLNDLLVSDSSSMFLTLFYVVLDLEEMEMTFASAGHNDMFHFSRDSSLQTLRAKGLPLGMLEGQIYENRKLSVLPGDSLILYTDGIPELENPGQELFGVARLEDFCRIHISDEANRWVVALENTLDEFRRGISPSDDVTALRVKIPENFSKIGES